MLVGQLVEVGEQDPVAVLGRGLRALLEREFGEVRAVGVVVPADVVLTGPVLERYGLERVDGDCRAGHLRIVGRVPDD